MARFTNVSGEELLLFARAGQAESFAVPPGGTVEVPGDVTAETDDAVVVGDGDDARAWPAALWELDRPDDGGVPAPQLAEDTAADAAERDNERAAANVAASEGTATDRQALARQVTDTATDTAETGGTTERGE